SIFHAFKQKFGSSVSSRHIASARSEVYCKAILHNIFLLLARLSGQTPSLGLVQNGGELYAAKYSSCCAYERITTRRSYFIDEDEMCLTQKTSR
ncbi:hypothetical protein K9M74_05110, partial [Candidatus Woesearchaeota archaeon]|nr:hypothetical protein [Candidatus Woesearchaeota archaeon]